MAFGLLLRVSWICFLLFDGSAALPAIKGYGYPNIADSRNIGDDGEDEVLTSPTFDQSYWQASNNQPTGPVYMSNNKPTVARQPGWVPPPQNLPYTPAAPEVERPLNAVPEDSGLEKPDRLLLPPFNYQLSDPAEPQPGPVQPQFTSLDVASTNSLPASPSAGDSTYSSPTAYYEPAPSATSQAAKSPSFVSWQPAPVSSSYYGLADFNTGSGAAGGGSSNTHLVYEDVFQYPSENTEPSGNYVFNTAGGYGQADYTSRESSTGYAPTYPSYPTNVGAQPGHLSGLGSASSGVNLNSGRTDYQPRDEISWRPQKPVARTQEVEVSQRVSEPIYPSYMFQSRNGYQLGRYVFSQRRYTPEYPSPMPVSSPAVKGPAPTQPAAPKGVKNPQRTKW